MYNPLPDALLYFHVFHQIIFDQYDQNISLFCKTLNFFPVCNIFSLSRIKFLLYKAHCYSNCMLTNCYSNRSNVGKCFIIHAPSFILLSCLILFIFYTRIFLYHFDFDLTILQVLYVAVLTLFLYFLCSSL